MSTCLPLPPDAVSFRLLLASLYLLPLPASSSVRFFVFFFSSRICPPPLQGGPAARALATTFILGPCTTPIRNAEKSFHANSSENAFFVKPAMRRRRCRTRFPVKTVTRRPTDRKQHRPGIVSSALILLTWRKG